MNKTKLDIVVNSMKIGMGVYRNKQEHEKNKNLQILRYPAWIWFIGSITLSASVLFYHLGMMPLQTWDEARLADNALEMATNGLSLITTYNGSPDHWNTKPPLVIWLMSLSIQIFGPIEISVRLPSVIAAMATIIIVFTFCNYHLKKPLIGFLAILILLSNIGYIQAHGARSGNYDAMLTLWTTGYLLSGYMYIQNNSNRILWLSLFMLGIFLAFFTKTIQGLIFLPAILMYALFFKKISFALKCPLLYVYIILMFVVCIGYYYARDHVDPGYINSALSNDLIGRYSTVIESHGGDNFYYVKQIKIFPWMILSLGIAFFQFWKSNDSELKKISVYLGLTSFFYLIIISSASTKLAWYGIPLYPLSSIIVAIAAYQLLEWMLSRLNVSRSMLEIIFLVTFIIASIQVFALNVHFIKKNEDNLKSQAEGATPYNFFLRAKYIQRKKYP